MKPIAKLTLLILILSTLVCCHNLHFKKKKPVIKLPENTPTLIETPVGERLVLNILDSMSKAGMKTELIDAMNKYKDNNTLKILILRSIKPLDYEDQIISLVEILEYENKKKDLFKYLDGGFRVRPIIMHNFLRSNLIEMLQSKMDGDTTVIGINDYDQVQDFILRVKEKYE